MQPYLPAGLSARVWGFKGRGQTVNTYACYVDRKAKLCVYGEPKYNPRSLWTRDRGLESHSGRGCLMCVFAFFCVCVFLCLGRGFATGSSPVQGALPSVNDEETDKSALCSEVGGRGGKNMFNFPTSHWLLKNIFTQTSRKAGKVRIPMFRRRLIYWLHNWKYIKIMFMNNIC
jgi:hypothetical protein